MTDRLIELAVAEWLVLGACVVFALLGEGFAALLLMAGFNIGRTKAQDRDKS